MSPKPLSPLKIPIFPFKVVDLFVYLNKSLKSKNADDDDESIISIDIKTS
jgi:hypothetical protein